MADKICTRCGLAHNPRWCPLNLAFVAVAGVLLAGCDTSEQIDVTRLKLPPKQLMQACPPQPPIPACEGDAKCRVSYYGESRQAYGRCADKAAGLQRYVRAITKQGR